MRSDTLEPSMNSMTPATLLQLSYRTKELHFCRETLPASFLASSSSSEFSSRDAATSALCSTSSRFFTCSPGLNGLTAVTAHFSFAVDGMLDVASSFGLSRRARSTSTRKPDVFFALNFSRHFLGHMTYVPNTQTDCRDLCREVNMNTIFDAERVCRCLLVE